MPPKAPWQPTDRPSSERILQAFRMPRELVSFLKAEAQVTERDLTGYVNRMLDGLRTWFGLPSAASLLLEADREALRMQRYEYFLHLLYLRSLEIREKGPGFDSPTSPDKKTKK